ncbi:hypothetical protein QUC32_02555 [Novosphingobium resinovorum]|uniref:ABC-three component system protein n=1 Tax=Novosphingobium resinovorum TaxID=158500 RepID=UPI0025A19322|nr:ABC-three component system protein [Novosphingobium resinovorum]MBF7013721.1 hypothetical protein [Novosphingobium sp. HR1a]WJM25863.1 hypothetical protein QUC32_02555 [Novosphingobium resinovorum]
MEQWVNSRDNAPSNGSIAYQNEPGSRIAVFSLEILNGLLGKRMTGGHIRTRGRRGILRGLATKSDHNAAPMASGVVLQFERALYHLAIAGDGEAVSVEQVDDVARTKDGKVRAQEQDKKSVSPRSNATLGDRHIGLWRTLQIWVEGIRTGGQPSLSYLLVTNAQPKGKIVDAIRKPAGVPDRSAEIVTALRAAGKVRKVGGTEGKAPSKIQETIDDVLSESDAMLTDLAGRIELVEKFDATAMRPDVAARLGIHPDADRDFIIDATLGWIVTRLREAWDSRAAGVITKNECLRYVRTKEAQAARRQWMPRPGREIHVGGDEIANARGRTFVDQLKRIELDDEEVFEAIEHWVQFNTEKSRLVKTGDIDDEIWVDRGDRLRQRWQAIERHARRTRQDLPPVERGYHVYSETTLNHQEPIDGHPCAEPYVTTGHFHRLADDKQIRWHPEYGDV